MSALHGLLCENKSLVLWGECCEPSSGLALWGLGEVLRQSRGHTLRRTPVQSCPTEASHPPSEAMGL